MFGQRLGPSVSFSDYCIWTDPGALPEAISRAVFRASHRALRQAPPGETLLVLKGRPLNGHQEHPPPLRAIVTACILRLTAEPAAPTPARGPTAFGVPYCT